MHGADDRDRDRRARDAPRGAAQRTRREQGERRHQLHVVVPEEPQTDRHRHRARQEPQPEVGVAPAVVRRQVAIAPRLWDLPEERQVARDPPERHEAEHRDHQGRRGVDTQVRAVAEHRPVEELGGADGERDERGGDGEAQRDAADPPLPPCPGEQVHHREERRRPGLLRQRGGGDHRACRDAATATREEDRGGHRGQHEHLEVRGLAVLGGERDHRR